MGSASMAPAIASLPNTVDALPRTETGKLQKFRLVEAIVSGALSPAATF